MTRPTMDSFDVSFVMPLYEKQAWVERAIGSALGQTLAPREIVVVDDGSRDNGPEIVARMAQSDARVRLVRQANAGPSAARNRGISEAKGAWIAFLDADDMALPNHLERLAALAGAFPEAGVVAAGYREVKEGEHQGAVAALVGQATTPGILIDRFFERWIRETLFFTSSVAVRRTELERLGGVFPIGEKLGEDLDVWFRLAERTPVAWTPTVGALYTVGHGDSITQTCLVSAPLPAFERLARRIDDPAFPAAQRAGARRLVATHWLNVARGRITAGDAVGAWRLIGTPIARRRPVYWLRSALVAAASTLAARPVKLGPV